MNPFVDLLYEAADDPDVVSIKITLYRLAGSSRIAAALAYAAEHGKQVQCLLELRARFDEQSNIDYSRMLEDAGCDILYGLTQYKVHTKLCLITRRCPGGICYYTQVGTGNYNEKTAEQYTDLMLLTSDPAIGRDAARTFDRLARGETVGETESLWIAPEGYKPQLMAHIESQIRLGAAGFPNLLVSAAINDIGFIAWNKASSMHGTVSRRLTFDGAQVDASGVADIDFDLGELKFEQVDEESATRMLHYTMNLGAEYRLWDRRVGFGALYQIHKYDYAALHNLTASVNFQPMRWFGLSGSYSFIDNRASALGLGLNLNPGWINFYVATDVLLTKKSAQWIPIKQGRMNFNLGIGVPMGKRGLRQRDCIRVNAACCPSQEPLTEQQELRIREQQLREQASATSEQIEEATERSEKAIRKAERRAAKAERKARKAAERAQQEGDTASVVRAAADLLAVRY